MDYLVRFAQVHENFRKAELQALADLCGIRIEFLDYNQYVSRYSLRNLNVEITPTICNPDSWSLVDGV